MPSNFVRHPIVLKNRLPLFIRLAPVSCQLGLALLLGLAPLAAQTLAAPPMDAPLEDMPETPEMPEHTPPERAAEHPASGSTTSAPDDVNAPNDPPPVSALFPDGGGDEAPPDMSQSVTINLLKIMVKKGLLTQMEAIALIQQAEHEALAARAAAKAKKDAEAAEQDEAMRVSYVPESVRREMKQEITNQVVQDLRGGVPAPGGKGPFLPSLELGKAEGNLKPFADIRLRYELVDFPEGNDNTGAFPNFNAINTGAPFDTAGLVFSPQRNVDQERQRYRLRVRVGGEWDFEDGLAAGIRVATGENNSPVSTNQSLGASGGNFSKYSLWLDRAFIKYHTDFSSDGRVDMELTGGRFDNPFMASEALFDEDLGFDGLALKLKGKIGERVSPFLTAGAFPIYNTDFNFATNQPAKFESEDRYMYGVQLGADFRPKDDLSLKLGLAYYNFDDVQGRQSEPFIPLSASDAGSTDHTRPSFAQYGNTYMPLRWIIPDVTNNYGTSSQYQYFGLASKFTPFVVSGKMEYSGWEPAQVQLFGEYIKNTSFNRREIEALAVNNRGAVPESGDATASAYDPSAPPRLGVFDGDDTAWVAGIKFGKLALSKRGDWMLGASYRWVGSDAVVDGFNDSDFGGGGTNVKGCILQGAVALSPHAIFGVQWLSSDQIAGPPLRNDTLQVDFKFKF